MSGQRAFVAASAFGGLLAAAVAAARMSGTSSLVDALVANPGSVATGAVCGGIVGMALWVVLHPRLLNRLAFVLVAIHWSTWVLFLAAVPRLSEPGDPIEQQRLEGASHFFTDHPPSLLAGRPVTWMGLPEKPLLLMAGPMALFVESLAVPTKYWQTGPTIRESFWIAWIAFVGSTAWWITFALLWSSRRRRVGRQSRTSKPGTDAVPDSQLRPDVVRRPSSAKS
jgi:hypothetical protein